MQDTKVASVWVRDWFLGWKFKFMLTHFLAPCPTHLSALKMTARTNQTLASIAIAICIHVAEGGAASRRRLEQEELDKQRFKQPFAIIFFSVLLAVSLPLFRFVHCIFTDPLMPPLFKELKKRAARILNKRFGSIGCVVEKMDDVYIDIDIDDDEYGTMRSID